MIAVGACDDAVQVLQCVEPSTAKLSTKGSIFQYCELPLATQYNGTTQDMI